MRQALTLEVMQKATRTTLLRHQQEYFLELAAEYSAHAAPPSLGNVRANEA